MADVNSKIEIINELEVFAKDSKHKLKEILQMLGMRYTDSFEENSGLIFDSLQSSKSLKNQFSNEKLLPDEFPKSFLQDPNLSIIIDENKLQEIFPNRTSKEQVSCTSAGQYLATFNACERNALYEYTLKHTVGIKPPPELFFEETFSSVPTPESASNLTPEEFNLQQLKEYRDKHRRRQAYRTKVSTKNKSYTEISREIIGNMMQAFGVKEEVNDDLKSIKEKENDDTNKFKNDTHRNDVDRHSAHRNDVDRYRNDIHRYSAHKNDTNNHSTLRNDTNRQSAHRNDTDRHSVHRSDTSRHRSHRNDTDRFSAHMNDTDRLSAHRNDTDRLSAHRNDTDRLSAHRNDTDRLSAHRNDRDRCNRDRSHSERHSKHRRRSNNSNTRAKYSPIRSSKYKDYSDKERHGRPKDSHDSDGHRKHKSKHRKPERSSYKYDKIKYEDNDNYHEHVRYDEDD